MFRKLLPWGTRRRYYYELVLTGLRIIRDEGWRSFWSIARERFKTRFKLRLRDDYRIWISRNEPAPADLEQQKQKALSFTYRPKISIITPVWNVSEKCLRLALESVISQTYDNWEMCIADGGSDKPHIRKVLEEYARKEPKIKIKLLPQNLGISGNSNAAFSLATGEFIALLDHDDELAPFALYEVVKILNEKPEIDFIYSDEDKITPSHKRTGYFFKPDWSPDMFLSWMYTCHLGVYRRSIFAEIGGFRPHFDGSQDYDLVLRFIEKTNRIYHIPRVLYHWRISYGSAASDINAKPYALIAAKNAIGEYLARNNIDGMVVDGIWPTTYRVKRKILGNPLATVIIPSKDNGDILKICLNSIISKTDYDNYEILLVDNNSRESKTLDYYHELAHSARVKILHYDEIFNYSAVNNYAVSQAKGEHLLFLNDDTEIISAEWLSAMLEHSQRQEVGAVGAKLLFPDKSIQHCGVILGFGPDRVAGHLLYRSAGPRGDFMKFMRTNIISDFSAVTAACMMMRKTVFQELGGFENTLPYAYNDVDLCLKIREGGYLIVYTPYAQLYHLESYTRGYEDTPEKRRRFRREAQYIRAKWGRIIDRGDPYYNPNFTLDKDDFSLKL